MAMIATHVSGSALVLLVTCVKLTGTGVRSASSDQHRECEGNKASFHLGLLTTSVRDIVLFYNFATISLAQVAA